MENKALLRIFVPLMLFMSSYGARRPNDFFALKKPLLASAKTTVNHEKTKNDFTDNDKNSKKSNKKASIIRATVDSVKNKVTRLIKKVRLFYRRHFYLSLVGLGLTSVVFMYCLYQFGVPFLQQYIRKYMSAERNGSGNLVEGASAAGSAQADQAVVPDNKLNIESLEQAKIVDKSILENQKEILENSARDTVPEKIVRPVDLQSTESGVQTPAQTNPDAGSLNEPKSEIIVQKKPNEGSVGLPFGKVRTLEEIEKSEALYYTMKDFINDRLDKQVDELERMKQNYEQAQKSLDASPYDIKIHNDCMQKKKKFLSTKNKTAQAIKEAARNIDVAEPLSVGMCDETKLGKPRMVLIGSNRASKVARAFVYEKFYVGKLPLLPSEEFEKGLYSAVMSGMQKRQQEELGYMSGLLRKVLLPFIENF